MKKQSSVSIFCLSMTRSEKKYFLRSVVQWCFISLTLSSCRQVLLLNNESKFGLDFPLSILNISIKSALLRLSSRVQRLSCRKRSLYGRTFIPGTILVKRCCTFSNKLFNSRVMWWPNLRTVLQVRSDQERSCRDTRGQIYFYTELSSWSCQVPCSPSYMLL